MRKLLPLVLLASIFYAAWFYWQGYSDRPLQEVLLPIAAADIEALTIQVPDHKSPFTLTRVDNDWVVARPPQQILNQSLKAEELVSRLTALRTDSVGHRPPKAAGVMIRIESKDGSTDELVLHQPPSGVLLATIPATGDVYYLNPTSSTGIMPQLRFNHFREPRLLNLRPNQVDSLVVSYHDSLLWRASPEEIASLTKQILAPAAAPYADYFDEIAHRDRYYADLDFYFSGRAHRVQVFQDSLWPQPFVLVGEDYPRRYLGFEEIRQATTE